MPSSDDIDLPEFDFRTACGISKTTMSKPPVNVQLDKRLLGLFDDDDMPEWCPPELQRQSLPETTTAFPSRLWNPTSHNLARGPPRPVLPTSPSPASTRPPFSSLPFPPGFHCSTTKSPLSGPLRSGPNSSLWPNSNSILGPTPNWRTLTSNLRPTDPINEVGGRGNRVHGEIVALDMEALCEIA
ncbi:hypothetical protein Acr_13g0011100 [Actinidia rufa]|uniref:Uncharacterized protein n=1 Tax=Actinidia rufa TaxID=165716 RepID=A0A7J0FM50_9ERIC|nr:hypothetical protein Acr_13g0011100 [Actinidia rufa]